MFRGEEGCVGGGTCSSLTLRLGTHTHGDITSPCFVCNLLELLSVLGHRWPEVSHTFAYT